MKKSSRIILIAGICLLSVGIVLSSVVLMFGISGASYGRILQQGLWNTTFRLADDYDNTYEKSNVYRVPAEDIDALVIDWIAGDVTVEPYDGSEILIKESADGKLNEDTCLRYKVEDDTLMIYFCAETAGVSFSGDQEKAGKKLLVKIPKKLSEDLPILSLDTISSDVSLTGLAVEDFTATTVSGSITGAKLKFDFASISTVSGSVKADFLNCPEDFLFDSTSGSCCLGLPKNSNAEVSYDSVSGSIYNQFRHRTGHGNGQNAGQCQLSLSTISGDVKIFKGSCK